MKTFVLRVLVPAAFCAAACAQQWEVGAVGGAGFLNTVPVSSPGRLGHGRIRRRRRWRRLLWTEPLLQPEWRDPLRLLREHLKLSSGGTSASFTGIAHALHYDLIWHTRRKNSPTQYYLAVGGGMKLFQGLGSPEAYQPLMQFGYFTRAHAIEPMGTVARRDDLQAGAAHVSAARSAQTSSRPFPTGVLTPAVAPAAPSSAAFEQLDAHGGHQLRVLKSVQRSAFSRQLRNTFGPAGSADPGAA